MTSHQTKAQRDQFFMKFPKELTTFAELHRALNTYSVIARSAVDLNAGEADKPAAKARVADAVEQAREWARICADRATNPAAFLKALQLQTLDELNTVTSMDCTVPAFLSALNSSNLYAIMKNTAAAATGMWDSKLICVSSYFDTVTSPVCTTQGSGLHPILDTL